MHAKQSTGRNRHADGCVEGVVVNTMEEWERTAVRGI